MLTPKFELQQDEAYVTVKIFAPYAHITDTEISINDELFIFYSSPYYLRLTFSGKLVNDELEEYSARFDVDAGAFYITCKKENPCEHFANFDLLTMLLAPQGAVGINRPSIEIIGGDDLENDKDDDFDFTIEQSLPEENILTKGYKYGFGNNSTGVFSVLQNELKDIVDVCDPDNKCTLQRRKERITQELNLFNEHHYLADYFEADMMQDFIEFIPEFYNSTKDEVEFSEQDKKIMLQLPRREYLLDKETNSIACLGLADILFAWCYNHRITLGENCSESAWNVAKLSSTLSWLDSFTSLKDVVVSSIRRSLTFPMVRNWNLSQQVLKDTSHVLSLGKKKVLKCFFEIKGFFTSDRRYILNQLYIDDYCVWLQKVKEDKFIHLADFLRQVKVSKSDLDLDLDTIEAAGHLVLKEESVVLEENINSIVTHLDKLTVIENGAVLDFDSSEPHPQKLPIASTKNYEIGHIDDIDSTSSDSDDESDDTNYSNDSSDDSSDNSNEELSLDSSKLDSSYHTLSQSNDD